MNRAILILAVSFIVSVELAAETNEYDLEGYLNQSYQVTNQKLSGLEYYIVASRPETLKEGFEYLSAESVDLLERSRAFSIIGTVLAAYPSDDYNAQIETFVREVEDSYQETDSFSIIHHTYAALAQMGTKQSLNMLQERASFEFWEDRKIPSITGAFSDRPNEPFTENAQSVAISQLGEHPLPEAEKLLKELAAQERFMNDPVLQRLESIETALFKKKESDEYRRNRIAEALELKKSIFGTAAATKTKEPIVEVPATPPAPDVEEGAQEVTQLEPAKEETVEVDTPETIEEPAEQSSPWWLWLVGALVVVGGLGLVLRRKS